MKALKLAIIFVFVLVVIMAAVDLIEGCNGRNVSRYVCSGCYSEFSSRDDLDAHIAREHRIVVNEPDDTCLVVVEDVVQEEPTPAPNRTQRPVTSDESQNRTQQPVTPPAQTFECNTCHKKFSTQAELKAHIPTHEGQSKKKNEHKYQCDQCMYWFNSQKELDDHKWIKHEK